MATLWSQSGSGDLSDRFARLRAPAGFADLTIMITDASLDGLRRPVANYGSGGLRRSRSVRKYTDRLMRARVTPRWRPPTSTTHPP
jgi:hypothetical protein